MRKVMRHRKTGQIIVRVAYGTTNMDGHKLNSFPVAKIADMDLAGLHQATRFILTEMKWAPWDSRFFRCLEGMQTPVLGRLSDAKTYELATQMRMLEAKLGPL
ncbi:hypothetical protein [Ferrovibrio sp.]|uniref:hypothetical protein n=1 Tax=Ferrovibrio sp. TaxID=1917215 RepID=UPI00311F2A4B